MRYKTTVTYVTGGKEYQPGDILPADISLSDLSFLKSKKFVVPAVLEDDTDGYKDSDQKEDRGDFSGFDELEPDTIKSQEEIRKIRSKKDAFHYAAAIGLNFEDGYENRSLKELQEEIINFQEEQMDDEED